MHLDLKRLLTRSSRSDLLLSSRQALFDSFHPRRFDRRREVRVPIRHGDGPDLRRGEGRILNLGRLGLAVEVEDHCRFARGEHHCLTLRQGLSSIEVEGVVRWTHSDWGDSTPAGNGGYRQIAGFSLETDAASRKTPEWKSIASTIQATPKALNVSKFEPVRSCSEPKS